MMGMVYLYLHLVLDGNSTLVQDRFDTVAACEAAVVEMKQTVGGDYGVRIRSHVCIDTEGK
jgi:hypothetical protein